MRSRLRVVHLPPLPRASAHLGGLHWMLLLLDALPAGGRASTRRRIQQRADLRHLARVALILLVLALSLLLTLLVLRIVLLLRLLGLVVPITLHQRRDRGVVRVVRREGLHLPMLVVTVVHLLSVMVRRRHRRETARRRGRARRRLEGRGDQWTALVRELVRARARMRALEETTLVAELNRSGSLSQYQARSKVRRDYAPPCLASGSTAAKCSCP